MNKTKLNPGSVASYDLWPGNKVVTILVKREGMDERTEKVKRTRKGKSKKEQKMRSEWTREEKRQKRDTPAPVLPVTKPTVSKH